MFHVEHFLVVPSLGLDSGWNRLVKCKKIFRKMHEVFHRRGVFRLLKWASGEAAGKALLSSGC